MEGRESVLENLVVYRDKRVFITGHGGIKGSWLVPVLLKLGVKVKGYSNEFCFHYDLIKDTFNKETYESTLGDILDRDTLNRELIRFNPDLVIHLAAQSIVSVGYTDPLRTFETNVIGTLNVLETCKDINVPVICITTDKVYKNLEQIYGYKENDVLWGSDPYSASKVCAEQVIDSYKYSYNMKIATARAGNIICGGEQSKDRIITDIMNAYRDNTTLVLRRPKATRPFQHVLDALFGYLRLGEELLKGNSVSGGWNFSIGNDITVEDLVKEVNKHITVKYVIESSYLKETNSLCLDNTKTKKILNYTSLYSVEQAIEKTCMWFKEYYQNNKVITINQIEDYLSERYI